MRSLRCSFTGENSSSCEPRHCIDGVKRGFMSSKFCLCAQVGNKDVLNCYYAHAEDSLQVRASPQHLCAPAKA